MKKSLFNIITLALVIVNLVLSVVMIFAILPASKKTDKMITQISSALNLELESSATADKKKNLTIDQMETYDIVDKLTIPLKKGSDGKDHFVIISASIVIDITHKDYKKYKDTLSTKESLIKDAINNVIAGFTIDEIQSNPQLIQDAVLKKLQQLYDSDFIVKVAFRDILFQ